MYASSGRFFLEQNSMIGKIGFATTTAIVLLFSSYHPVADGHMNYATKVREVNVAGRYSIMLPTYLTEGFDLNSEASLQYQNVIKEVYIIVIDEPKQEFIDVFREIEDYDTTKSPLENYARAQMESIRSNMSVVTSESPIRLVQTGCGQAIMYDVAGTQEGIDDAMGFTVGFYEGKLNLYMIMIWTFEKTKSVYQADMDAMLVSFKELSGAINSSPYHIQNEKFSVEFPRFMTQDTTTSDYNIVNFSSSEKELYVSVNEHLKSNWDEGYKAWPERKTSSLLDYFTVDQRNFIHKNSPKDTHSSETLSGKSNGSNWRTFSFTEGPVDDIQWYREFRIIEGKAHFYFIEIYCPLSAKESNSADTKSIFESFKVL